MPLNQPLVCGTHGRRPWKGHIVCANCNRVFQTQNPDEPRYAQDVCPCEAQLSPADAEDRDFTARPICDLCYEHRAKQEAN